MCTFLGVTVNFTNLSRHNDYDRENALSSFFFFLFPFSPQLEQEDIAFKERRVTLILYTLVNYFRMTQSLTFYLLKISNKFPSLSSLLHSFSKARR